MWSYWPLITCHYCTQFIITMTTHIYWLLTSCIQGVQYSTISNKQRRRCVRIPYNVPTSTLVPGLGLENDLSLTVGHTSHTFVQHSPCNSAQKSVQPKHPLRAHYLCPRHTTILLPLNIIIKCMIIINLLVLKWIINFTIWIVGTEMITYSINLLSI